MKIITIEVPDDADTERVTDAAKRAADPNWIAVWWGAVDVLSNDGDDSDLTDEECLEVLRLADAYHDANNGINWDTLTDWTDHVKGLRTAAVDV